ncbi:CPBP family intramembrane glutamic endopeptidase [Flavobacterium sp.]|uniref:CPBP family intramembrane glutamic endopeptidase n=1 Tax=Flavobacterium sp. TaxID=239 RepID=UPI00263144A5|nr:CPBP family intramembrane glutamic endopeptidase [Flavobacterium sp.]MDD3003719.1 CPBP family intramembrane metalloprotease [Flavobacterium sp.]
MFIEQLNQKKVNLFLYLPVPVCFIALIVANYFSSEGVDTQKFIHSMIDTIGVNATFVILVGPLSAMCLGLLFWVQFIHQQSIKSLTTSRQKVDWKRIFLSFSVWGIFVTGSILISNALNPEQYIYNFKLIPFLTFLVLALILIPLQTSFEEYFFRGYLMQGLGLATKTRWVPFIVTSLAFGLMHIANPEVGKIGYIILIYYIGTGFFLGILTLMDEGLELALGFHAANNLFGALLLTSDWSAFQTHSIFKDNSQPSAGFEVIMPVFVFFPLLILIFSKIYGWKNWSQKLFGSLSAQK